MPCSPAAAAAAAVTVGWLVSWSASHTSRWEAANRSKCSGRWRSDSCWLWVAPLLLPAAESSCPRLNRKCKQEDKWEETSFSSSVQPGCRANGRSCARIKRSCIAPAPPAVFSFLPRRWAWLRIVGQCLTQALSKLFTRLLFIYISLPPRSHE